MYLTALDDFADQVFGGIRETFEAKGCFRGQLERFYQQALAVYTNDGMSRGCFIFCTGPAEATEDPIIGKRLAEIITKLDSSMAAYSRQAIDSGEILQTIDPVALGKMIIAMLHSLALRARAGIPETELCAFIGDTLGCLPWNDKARQAG